MWLRHSSQFKVQSSEAWVGGYAAGPHVSLFVSYVPLSHRRPSHVSYVSHVSTLFAATSHGHFNHLLGSPREVANPQGEARNPQHRSPVIHCIAGT